MSPSAPTDNANYLSVARSLTLRYVIALSLVATLSTAAWISLRLVISDQKSTAALVNVSGRQRMLSQRTALFSNLLVHAAGNERPLIRGKLKEAIDLMARSHHGLTHGDKAMELPDTMSPAVHSMYFDGPDALDGQVETYIRTVQDLLRLDDGALTSNDPRLRYITQTAPTTLVSALDRMVRQYQSEGEASVARLQQAETIFWAVTLLLLMLEAALIFHPFVGHVRTVIARLRSVTDELQLHKAHLEELVSQRTAELEHRSQELEESEKKLRITASVFDNSQEAILITDADNNIIELNPSFARITGYSRDEVIGKNPRLLSSGRQSKAFYAAMWQSIQQQKSWHGEIWNRRKSGEVYPELLSITVISDSNGKALRHVGIFSDISHIKEHENELRRVAHYDALTGIPNRVLLADRMGQAIAQTSREHNMVAVCYLDLDGFKPINDALGHEAGDQVLVEVAKRIENTIRGGDTVSRLGGDEFVVLLLGLEKGEECVATLERLLAAIAQPITVKNKLCTLSASIGVSIYPLDDEDPDTLLRHADQAMYVAKQTGKNRFHIYDPALDRRAREQYEFLKNIRQALERGQFELYYQPKINLRTKQLVGAEALIRWRHPERGLLPPAEFLHFIENTDLDIEIGEWVIATSLAQLNHWRTTGLDIEVSINISGYHLESSRFTERLQQQLARYPDIPFGRLQIEVLETVALNDITVVREIIGSCRKIGVGFALDDFGTGYSSLSYLSSLPVDVLKIDQSFVRDMLEDKGDMAIVQGIIALARAFDRKTVAEGIETDEHYQVLLDMGCEVGQGYGIARPMPSDKLSDWHAR